MQQVRAHQDLIRSHSIFDLFDCFSKNFPENAGETCSYHKVKSKGLKRDGWQWLIIPHGLTILGL
jgi:hypothetical protein